MKFNLEVDLDKLSGDEHAELSRILRYWAGNLKHYQLEAGAAETLWDSTSEVGIWKVSD